MGNNLNLASSNKGYCVTCGKKLPRSLTNNKCVSCQRKEYVSRILKELIKAFGEGTAFNKNDLMKLGHSHMKARDYISVLNEFNLLNYEGNDTFSLKEQKILSEYIIEDNNTENNKNLESEVSKSKIVTLDDFLKEKECAICHEKKPESDFFISQANGNLEGCCKSCKRSVIAARYLRHLLNFVGAEQEFTANDISDSYKSIGSFYSQIWFLEEFNLLHKEYDVYTMETKEVLESFLDKYFLSYDDLLKYNIIHRRTSENTNDLNNESEESSEVEGTDENPEKLNEKEKKLLEKTDFNLKKHEKSDVDDEDIPVFEYAINSLDTSKLDVNDLEKLEMMDIIINQLKEGKTKKEVFHYLGINISKIMSWCQLAEKGNELYIGFYEEYKYLENNKLIEPETEETRRLRPSRRRKFKSKYKSRKKSGHKSRNNSVNGYQESEKENKPIKTRAQSNYKPQELTINGTLNEIMNNILESLSTGLTPNEAVEEAGTSLHVFSRWLSYGKRGNKDYIKFYQYFNEITNNKYLKENGEVDLNIKNPKLKKTKVSNIDEDNFTYKYNYNKSKHEKFINAVLEGKSRDEALKTAKIKERDLIKWHKRGIQGIQPYYDFYMDHRSAEKYLETHRDSFEDNYFNSDEIQAKLKEFLKEIQNKCSIKVACRKAHISEEDIRKWLGFGYIKKEPYLSFLNEYEKAKKDVKSGEKFNKKLKEETIQLMKDGKTFEEAIKIINNGENEELLLKWFNSGMKGSSKHLEFYKEIKSIEQSIIVEETEETKQLFNYNEKSHRKVIDAIKNGKTLEQAANEAGVNVNDINHWIDNASTEPFVSFYIEYRELNNSSSSSDLFELEEYEENLNIFFDAIKNGKKRKEAAKEANLELKLITNWISEGKNGKKPYVVIAEKYKEAQTIYRQNKRK